MNKYHIFYFLIIFFFLSACGTGNRPFYGDNNYDPKKIHLPSESVEHRLYLIGDAGGLDSEKDGLNYVFQAVKDQLKTDVAEKSIVFLGDNVYDNGLGSEDDPNREQQEKILKSHLSLATSTDANTYFIPGNHDWNNNKKGGRAAILRQADYVKSFNKNDSQIEFYPKNACGDPKVVKVNKDLVYVFIDSQWWVHDWSSETDINDDCK